MEPVQKQRSVLISKAYLFTYLTEFMVILAGILVYKLADMSFGKDGFNEYSVGRRTLSFLQPVLIIGLGVGLPRYVAFSATDHRKQNAYLMAALYTFLVVIGFLVPVFFFFQNTLSYLFFGSTAFTELVLMLGIMIIGIMFHTLAYGYFRGTLQMQQANVLQFLNLGIIPCITFIFSKNVQEVLLYTGAGWLVFALIFLLPQVWKHRSTGAEVKAAARELFYYGIQRAPGDMALAGFLSLPAYICAHMVHDDLETAGNVAFSMSLLNMVGAAFGPICLLLLPQASEAISKKDLRVLKRSVRDILWFTFAFAGLAMAVTLLFTDLLVSLFLSSYDPDLILIVRWVMPACLGYSVYISLRSVLDAYYIKAINTRNIILSFVLFILPVAGIVYAEFPLYYLFVSLLIAMSLLGFLTWYETMRIFRVPVNNQNT